LSTPTSSDGGMCTPKTCADYAATGVDCGQQSDGCGGVLNCGTCSPPSFCGGGGPSQCGVGVIPDAGACTPKTCADFPGMCGPQPDGCGGVTASCGVCTPPEICGGGGPSICGGGTVSGPDGGACTPITVCAPNQCGKIADGCGGILDCGTAVCTGGAICGGGGVPNQGGSGARAPPVTTGPPGIERRRGAGRGGGLGGRGGRRPPRPNRGRGRPVENLGRGGSAQGGRRRTVLVHASRDVPAELVRPDRRWMRRRPQLRNVHVACGVRRRRRSESVRWNEPMHAHPASHGVLG